jgi:hypothetical protein
MSQTASATLDPSGNVLAATINPPDSNSSAKLTYAPNAPLTLTGIEISTPQAGVAWNNGRGGQAVSCVPEVCTASATTAVGVAINALGPLAWNHQTFGYWLQETGSNTGLAGAISVGSPTPVGGIPVGGTANYLGVSGGIYVDAGGLAYEHAAVFSASADFAARSVSMTTSGTIYALTSGAGLANPAPFLDITGTLTYAPGINRFSGPITSGGTYMSGAATGRFYGPAAREIGGTYSLTRAGFAPESAIGAFGGKQ